MILVGNQSAFSAHPLTLPFDFAVLRGFDAFEWFPDRRSDGAGWGASDIGPAQRQLLRARARDAGVSLSVHAPVHADPLRPQTHRDLEDSLRLAVDLGARLLNIHFQEPGRADELARALVPWIDRCGVSGLKLAIENVPAVGPEDFNRLFAQLPRGCCAGMCLDVGHANLHQATRNDYIGYLDRIRPEVPIIHLHLHENHGDRDSHLVLFTGPAKHDPAGIVTLLDRLDRRGYEGSAILEQWPEPAEMLVRARERLLDLARGRLS